MVKVAPCSRWRVSFVRLLAIAAYLAWTVLAFPSDYRWTRTTCTATGIASIPAARTTTSPKARKHGGCARRLLFLQRGGEITASEHAASTKTPGTPYEDEISRYLASKGQVSLLLKRFEIQGWRWHTKSLMRDARRLHRLAMRTDPKNADVLRDASDYVVGFNLMGLHKIEATLFFPWMREKLTNNSMNKPGLERAFSSAMDVLEGDRKTVARLGRSISDSARTACNTELPESLRSAAISELATQSEELREVTQKMILLEDSFLAPAIGAMVPTKEQKSFNNKVLRKLGILDSRLHLVGMYEAVWEDGKHSEKELFEQAIPGISRQMIPRWKRKLYQPKTYMLE